MVGGHSGGSSSQPVPGQAQGAEYGLPAHQVRARGGEVTVKVPADVAERFNRAVSKHADSGEGVGSNIDSETHKSGMEPLTERARNLTEVAEEKMRTGGTGETRTPEVGFPASESAGKEGPMGQPPGQL
ncbi:CCR4-NOT transcription complex subunit 10 [Micractinium conductrix]|uniref:CCR4-NOT transcription complex subunit 10 n=1 Tax=Micractinium conductrix TaxID=554055 RepID=A0A2P6VB77_9CHLO|nr:CCR4-NOT transcription complex subunit 10 [Micractinium conductrix]|eukprot:PSC71328.1 CCR4-NOT transcription complex subunit 10 [Micractinium conductrix]